MPAPLTQPRRLWLIGRGLDVSFGTDERPPPSLMRQAASSARIRDVGTAAVAVCLELLLCGALVVGRA